MRSIDGLSLQNANTQSCNVTPLRVKAIEWTQKTQWCSKIKTQLSKVPKHHQNIAKFIFSQWSRLNYKRSFWLLQKPNLFYFFCLPTKEEPSGYVRTNTKTHRIFQQLILSFGLILSVYLGWICFRQRTHRSQRNIGSGPWS